MKKFRRYVSLFVMALLSCLLLTGCSAGSTINTTLTINNDLSGTRVMEVAIDDSVFSESFTGTMQDLNAVIESNCPAELTYTYSEDTGIKTYRFELGFSSVEDYQSKVNTLLGEGYTVSVQKSDSIWATGVYVNEDFTSEMLLAWLETALVDGGYVSSSDQGNIFGMGTTDVVFGSETYSTYDCISIDEIEYQNIDSIDILMEAVDIDSYNPAVYFNIPSSSMTAKGAEIEEFFKTVTPANATGA